MNSIERLLQEAKGITADSREVREGYVFFAIKGTVVDGNQYIEDAIENGAIGVVSDTVRSADLPVVYVENIREILAQASAMFYPKQPKHIVAITGTDGKTSVANICRQMWQLLGHQAASIGTMGVQRDNTPAGAVNTSPDPITLHKTLHELAEEGVEYVAIEASSIGIEQHRLDGVRFAAGGFTNFTRDHLDYHGTLEQYFTAKKRLFDTLLQDKPAILNADDAKVAELAVILENARTYGRAGEAFTLHSIAPTPHGLEMECSVAGARHTLQANLFGEFQAYNILCAMGLVEATGCHIADILSIIPHLQPIAGRLEQVVSHIFVDYAHTPDALQNALTSLRKHTEGRLIVVFGCGGDRDKGKRPLMGQVAATHADIAIITDDNPRSEDPATIRAEIRAGMGNADTYVIGDRAEAIHRAFDMMQADDILLVAGKGHENYQMVNNERLYFSDQNTVISYYNGGNPTKS